MQTGTKKTPDRFQNYFCPAAANDIVHHACKKEPSKNKSVSEKTCNARESSGRLDADRNVDRNDIAKDKEVK